MDVVVYIGLLAIFYFIEKGYIWLARREQIEDKPENRSSHSIVTVRGGGVLFYMAVLSFWLYAGFPHVYFFAGLTILSLVSFIDDIRGLSPKTRLVCQFVAMALMVSQVASSSIGIMLALIVLSTAVVNIVNFMDGINGMLSGMSLLVLGSLQYINYDVINFIEPEIIWFVLVSDIAFCFFNFKKKADCFAGDVGSMSMGYILFFLIIRLVWVSNDYKWFVLLGMFLADGGLTIAHRIILRENILMPHRKHAYEIMANELQIPHLKISILYMLIQAGFIVWYILVPTMTTFIAICAILFSLYLAFMMKYYPLHEKTMEQNKEIISNLIGKTILVVGEKAKKNVALHVKEPDKVRIVELEKWNEEAIDKYKPAMVLFE